MGQRSVVLDLIAPDEQRQPILCSIRRYRAALRELYAAFLVGNACGARIEERDGQIRLTPTTDAAKVSLASAIGAARIEKGERQRGSGQQYAVAVGAGGAYELRSWFLQELYPSALSFVWDSARRDVLAVWSSGDPEFPQAKRGWLALQGARGIARFQQRGIGFPVATGRPRLEGRELALKWDRDIKEVRFGLPRLDGGRYHVWRALRDGDEGWKLGTVYLTERDGKLRAVLTHERPDSAAAVEPSRVCTVTVSEAEPESLFRIVGPDGVTTHDSISGEEARGWLRQMLARRLELERRRAACGNPRAPWGHRRGWRSTQDVLSRLTRQRALGQADRNHAWTRRIVSRAVSWRCGVILVTLPAESELFGLPWGWDQFCQHLTYKAQTHGITVRFEASPTPDPGHDAG